MCGTQKAASCSFLQLNDYDREGAGGSGARCPRNYWGWMHTDYETLTNHFYAPLEKVKF